MGSVTTDKEGLTGLSKILRSGLQQQESKRIAQGASAHDHDLQHAAPLPEAERLEAMRRAMSESAADFHTFVEAQPPSFPPQVPNGGNCPCPPLRTQAPPPPPQPCFSPPMQVRRSPRPMDASSGGGFHPGSFAMMPTAPPGSFALPPPSFSQAANGSPLTYRPEAAICARRSPPPQPGQPSWGNLGSFGSPPPQQQQQLYPPVFTGGGGGVYHASPRSQQQLRDSPPEADVPWRRTDPYEHLMVRSGGLHDRGDYCCSVQ